MIGAALAALAAAAAGVRALYPVVVERRAARRRKLGRDGIIEGAAPIELPRDGAPALLLLHGAGDTPQVMSGLASFLHERGYAVRAPLLESHGRALNALAEASASAWRESVARHYAELRRQHPWVGVVGLSMGGALAARLAADLGDELPALVLLAPYIDMPRAVQRLARTTPYWRWLLPYFPTGGQRSVHDPVAAARGLSHGIMTPAALRALYESMTAGRDALPLVRSPILMVQSREDNRIAASSAERAFATLGAPEKELVWVDGAGHVITVDFGHERVFALVADWLDARRAVSPGERGRRSSRRSP